VKPDTPKMTWGTILDLYADMIISMK